MKGKNKINSSYTFSLKITNLYNLKPNLYAKKHCIDLIIVACFSSLGNWLKQTVKAVPKT